MPLFQNGNMMHYISTHPKDLLRLVHEVTLAVRYLHEDVGVHGYLKCENVLISDHGSALVTDFELSIVTASTQDVREAAPENDARVTSIPFLAPELFLSDDSYHGKTTATDIYALGMLMLQVIVLGILIAGLQRFFGGLVLKNVAPHIRTHARSFGVIISKLLQFRSAKSRGLP